MSKNIFFLDISIVTFNSEKWLDKFFFSLLNQNFPLSQINIFIRDNGSADKTVEILSQYKKNYSSLINKLEIDVGENLGFGRGHNVNLKKSESDFFLVTNVDLEFEKDTLVELVKQAQSDSNSVAQWECRQKPFEHPKNYNPATGETHWCSSACTLFRRSSLESVNGYEPRLFMYGEDVELSYRLRANGFILKYVPKATVWHYSYSEAEEFKPLQFYGSTYANLMLRFRYGSFKQILYGLCLFLMLFAFPQKVKGQRKNLFLNLFKAFKNAPYFFRTRVKDVKFFEFNDFDYGGRREGAFYEYKKNDKNLLVEKPLVSIIVRTTKNKGERLKEALYSIKAQTYTNFQVVVVEDGGDTASDVFTQFEIEFQSKIKYKSLGKMGRCRAGNEGLALADGELCCFLDDDDLLYADHLEVLVSKWLDVDPNEAVYAIGVEVRTDVLDAEKWKYKELDYCVMYRQKFNRFLLWRSNYFPIQTVLFPKQYFLKYGGFDPELDNLEDWNLWVRYSLENDFHFVEKTTSLYRVPAKLQSSLERQKILDSYYHQAVLKNSKLEKNFSIEEILNGFDELARKHHVAGFPISFIKKILLRNKLTAKFYFLARKMKNRFF